MKKKVELFENDTIRITTEELHDANGKVLRVEKIVMYPRIVQATLIPTSPEMQIQDEELIKRFKMEVDRDFVAPALEKVFKEILAQVGPNANYIRNGILGMAAARGITLE